MFEMSKHMATERCGCGASITVEAYGDTALASALQQFREMHIHIDPPDPNPWSFGMGVAGGGGYPTGGPGAASGVAGGVIYETFVDEEE